MQLLLLLAAMIVARSQCAQWATQQRGQNDNTVMAGDKELMSAADQTLSAYAGEYNLQKLLGFKHTPLYEWVPATKTSSDFSGLLDNADEEDDPSIDQQILQAATEDSENQLLFRLLQLYDLLPAQTSKWHKRRRRQDEEVQRGTVAAGPPSQRHDAALDFSDNSRRSSHFAQNSVLPLHKSDSFPAPPVEHNIGEVHVERTSDVTQSHNHLHGRRRDDREITAWGQEQGSSDGLMKMVADGAQTEVGEDPRKDYAFNKLISSRWTGKRATPFSVVGTAWRRAFNSWGGKRNPAFHSWGGKRSNSLAVQGSSRRWEANTDPLFGSEKEQAAFSIVGSGRHPPVMLGTTDEPTFTVLSSKTTPALSILRPKRDTAFSICDGKGDRAFNILGNHDYPAFSIVGTTYEATPGYSKRYRAFSNWGGKRDVETPDWEHQAKFFKRKPQFSSWGGKRYFDGDTQEKRSFSSWGGKRYFDGDTQEKRGFSSWGGKRYFDGDTQEKRGFSSWGGKRYFDGDTQEKRGFSSWGGKRYFDGDTQEKRGFSSWGGKRNLIPNYVTEVIDEMSKGRFSSWSGKTDTTKTEQNVQNSRSTSTKNSKGEHGPCQSDKERRNTSIQTSLAEAYQQLLKNVDCKIQFMYDDNYRRVGNGEETETGPHTETSDPAAKDQNSRNSEVHRENAEHEILSTVTKRSDSTTSGRNRVGKALFSPWGGKRSHVVPSLVNILGSMHTLDGLLNKRTSIRYESLGSKKWGPSPSAAVFSSWGGKRQDRLTSRIIQKAPPLSIGRQFRRGTEFYSWGGRR